MSVTYPADPDKPYGDRLETANADLTHEPFVPVYARRGKAGGGQGPVKTWMILTPVAVIVLGGIGAMLLLSGTEDPAAPLIEPAQTGPVLSAMPVEAPAVAMAPPVIPAATPEPVAATPPMASASQRNRTATPRPTPERAAPVRAAEPEAPAPTGPRAYSPATTAPSTSALTTAPVRPAAGSSSVPAPIIVIQPAG
jgi:hypothetical protein